MASVNFRLKGGKNPSSIYVRFRDGGNFNLWKKTGKVIDPKYWTVDKKTKYNGIAPKLIKNDPSLRNLNFHLEKLSIHLVEKFNEVKNPKDIDGAWLEKQIDIYNGVYKEEKTEINESILDALNHLIDHAHTRENSKGSLGLSKSRINSYKNLRKILKDYEGRKKIKVCDVNIKFGKEFLNWMLSKKNYSQSYARKKIDDIKTVCVDAELRGIPTSIQLKKVKGGKPKNDFIIYLNPDELEKIKSKDLENNTLENSKKWLLLGCNLGQRGADLLALRESNFVTRQGLELIELKQQKTGKNVTIPVLETTKEILQDGLPYPVSIQKFNDHLKTICKKAGIDEIIPGSKIVMVDDDGNELPKDDKGKYVGDGVKRKLAGEYPKWQLISSHVCRRSFASNLYGILPTPLIMQITAHSTEKMLLNYIGKSSMDYAQIIANFYNQNSN
ncbi:tyrosine-type recombinase/integrase [Salegentibacter mishustinae]|uniref:tyrosine-type recombinase/integrase n=1 Tax=Salegentibacter mishustinae TaxID=270918 RepID=UPI0024924FCE|nr:phage integrase SAM-like domain-containing protein [Salegentibacter mishustinae]